MELNLRQKSLIMASAEKRGVAPGRALAGRMASPMQLNCRGCGQFKCESNFHRDRRRGSGRSGECAPCTKARRAIEYQRRKAKGGLLKSVSVLMERRMIVDFIRASLTDDQVKAILAGAHRVPRVTG